MGKFEGVAEGTEVVYRQMCRPATTTEKSVKVGRVEVESGDDSRCCYREKTWGKLALFKSSRDPRAYCVGLGFFLMSVA